MIEQRATVGWFRPASVRASYCGGAVAVAVTVAWLLSHTRVFLAWVLVWPLVGAVLMRMGRIVWRSTFQHDPSTSAVACETVLIAVAVAVGVLATTALLGSPQSWTARDAVPLVLAVNGIHPASTFPEPDDPDAVAALDQQALAAQALRVAVAALGGAGAPSGVRVPVGPETTTTSVASATTTAVDTPATDASVTPAGSTTSAAKGSVRVTTTTPAVGSATSLQRPTTVAPGTVVGTVTGPTPATTAPPATTVPVTTAPVTTAPVTAAATTTPTTPTPAATTTAPTTAPTTLPPTTPAPTTTVP